MKNVHEIQNMGNGLCVATVVVPNPTPSEETINKYGRYNASYFDPKYRMKRLLLAGGTYEAKKQLEDEHVMQGRH